MSQPIIKADFPQLYKDILPPFFESERPREVFAKCENCAMVCHDQSRKTAMRPFLPDRKCCTFFPTMPNYLLGALLSDTDPAGADGRSRVRTIIKSRIGVTPMGIWPPMRYQLLYEKGSKIGFGNSNYLICPFFHKENLNCTIWRHRNAVCSTYFCKKVAARSGEEFWTALNTYMTVLENNLVNFILLEDGFSYEQIQTRFGRKNADQMTLQDLDDLPPTSEAYKSIWGDHEGKEEAYYVSAFKRIAALDRDKVAALTGVPGKIKLLGIQAKHHKMTTIPERLKPNKLISLQLGKDSVRVHLEQADIAFELPSVLFRFFDGERTWQQVIADLSEQEEMELDQRLLLSLYQYGILEVV